MSRPFPILAINSPQIVPIPGGAVGAHVLFLAFTVAPSAGTVDIDYRAIGSTQWVQLRKVADISITAGELAVRIDGPIAAIRITFAGLVGGSAPILWLSDEVYPNGLFTGLAAMTVQPYTEANVKNGLQFYIRAVWNKATPIPAGQTRKIWVSTGSSPIIVKSRVVEFDAEEVRLDIFAGPTGVTGGTEINPRNYNRINPVAAVSQAKKNVTTTTDGTPFDPDDPEHFFGSSNSPQRTPGAILQGRERILPANAEFIVAITNTGTSDARFQYFLDYYQGGTDLPL